MHRHIRLSYHNFNHTRTTIHYLNFNDMIYFHISLILVFYFLFKQSVSQCYSVSSRKPKITEVHREKKISCNYSCVNIWQKIKKNYENIIKSQTLAIIHQFWLIFCKKVYFAYLYLGGWVIIPILHIMVFNFHAEARILNRYRYLCTFDSTIWHAFYRVSIK